MTKLSKKRDKLVYILKNKSFKIKEITQASYKKVKDSILKNRSFEIKDITKVSIKKLKDSIKFYLIKTTDSIKSNKKIKHAYDSSSRLIIHEVIPFLQKRTDLIVARLVKEDGSDYWTALNPTQKWSTRIVWTLVGVSTFGVFWASFALIDETVQAQGRLEPKGTTIDVKVPLGGVINNILVKEGQLVKEDELLLQLDTTAVHAKLKALKEVRSQVKADISLSLMQLGKEVEIDDLNENQRIKMNSLIKEYESRINAAKSAVKQSEIQRDASLNKLNSVKEVLKIREKILVELEPLQKEGAISKVQYLKEKQEVIQIRSQLETLESDLTRYQEIFHEQQDRLNNTIASTKVDFSTKIEENIKQVAQLDNQISEAELTLRYQEIKSPLDGIVFDLQPAAPGYVVNSNLPILKIVPKDDLVARIFISNRDIGFLKKGQQVNIRVDAYPYSEFGEVKGSIYSIGSDVLEPDENYNFFRFPVTVSLEKPVFIHKNKELPLITGMSLSANIVLRQRPVISLFTEKVLPFWSGLEQM
ncbi:HlyD family type I secretion periplasmic adaptor subunit [Prochlorococcus marinus]|uniref:HlyD family type I secretion periplasmic adaptor subunit n=1 Tax=Prochlorococcus marinus TaxID=1219 RepID=UPI0022B44F1C|nr:HlyD family type I secretion periplasmic adaptor subunit [Prochlorococcus marinus]